MSVIEDRLEEFVEYVTNLSGDEKGEAQVFCDRLFQAFGHSGYKEAGATLEHRVRVGKGTKFADLFWKDRLLVEMKKRGTPLGKHWRQAFEYWQYLVPNRPRYVVLCNFDEFWIYDFNQQVDTPVDKIRLDELVKRFTAFNFLLPQETPPVFRDNLVAVTRDAADKVAKVYNSLTERGEDKQEAQHFVLQCVFAMFAEDIGLLPKSLFTCLLEDCLKGENCYDLIGGLFRQMSEKRPASGGRFKGIPYFNGGLFAQVWPVELEQEEIKALLVAAKEDWERVQPAVFGTIFQSSMGEEARHAQGAHFTSEADIQKVVLPTIVRPWRQKIKKAKTRDELKKLRKELVRFKVLDPACGSGNFLYVAYRELCRLEMEIITKIAEKFKKTEGKVDFSLHIKERQFYGLDNNPFAVELARVTLILAKELAVIEHNKHLKQLGILHLDLKDASLPLDNLDGNVECKDALLEAWPKVSTIIGNPPFQSKNKMQQEYDPAYLSEIRAAYPKVPGHADFCVYWLHRAHTELSKGQRAGLVGTNTIRQNLSRVGGLDYIVANGGTITEAVSTQVWPGEAVVHVSIVNWIKGDCPGEKKLYKQEGDAKNSPWKVYKRQKINSSLSPEIDVTGAQQLAINKKSKSCYQGQTHGNKGFLLSPTEYLEIIHTSPKEADVLFPYLTADELLSTSPPHPKRFVVDFYPLNILEAQEYTRSYKKIENLVLPDREAAANEEEERNEQALKSNPKAKVNRHHRNFLDSWWQMSYSRGKMLNKISSFNRYVVCGRVTKRPVFEFIASAIRPNDALQVFALDDDYSFGILQSSCHWEWFKARCSTLKGDYRYTSTSVFDTFPWPQAPTLSKVRKVAEAAKKLREFRNKQFEKGNWTLRKLYRALEVPGKNPLKDLHEKLDNAVFAAYGVKPQDPLPMLLKLNHEVAAREEDGKSVVAPGLPPCAKKTAEFISDDCVSMD